MLKRLSFLYILICLLARSVGGALQLIFGAHGFPVSVIWLSAAGVIIGIGALVSASLLHSKKALIYSSFLLFDIFVTLYNIACLSNSDYKLSFYGMLLVGTLASPLINILFIAIVHIPQRYVVKKVEDAKDSD